jgi:hypothetical protein
MLAPDSRTIGLALLDHPSPDIERREATVKMKFAFVNCGKKEMRILCYHYP